MYTKRIAIALVAMLAALALLTLSFAPKNAWAVHDVENVLGEWTGFFQSVALGGPDTKPVMLAIDQQRKNRFGGELGIGDPNEAPRLYPVAGSIGHRGGVVFQGASRDGEVAAKTSLHSFSLGGAILDGRLKQILPDGTEPAGPLLLLRPYEGVPCDNLYGRWQGMAVSAVNGARSVLTAEFIDDPNEVTGFFGRVSFEAAGIIILDFQIRGTNNNADHGTLLVGAGAEGQLIVEANHVNPPDDMPALITGSYRTTLADGSEDFGSFEIEMVL